MAARVTEREQTYRRRAIGRGAVASGEVDARAVARAVANVAATSGTADPARVAVEVVNQAAALGARLALVFAPEVPDGRLQLRALRNVAPALARQWGERPCGAPSWATDAARTRKTRVVRPLDPQGCQASRVEEMLRACEADVLLSVPFVAAGELPGVLALGVTDPLAASPTFREGLDALSDAAAGAMMAAFRLARERALRGEAESALLAARAELRETNERLMAERAQRARAEAESPGAGRVSLAVAAGERR